MLYIGRSIPLDAYSDSKAFSMYDKCVCEFSNQRANLRILGNDTRYRSVNLLNSLVICLIILLV